MADKITNFEDYKKRDVKQANKVETPKSEEPPRKEPKIPEVKQETMEIEIEDPYQFLNAQERDEYIQERKREQQRKDNPKTEPIEEPAPEETEDLAGEAKDNYDDEYDDEYDEEYEEEYAEEAEQADTKRGVNMELLVRVASIITGVVILACVALFLKAKVINRFFQQDPDEAVTVQIAIPEGFTEKNDTVTVSGASYLNLRSGPDTGSTIITAVNEGTQLKRIAVANDGSWAFVEYEGQQLYASMKYLQE